MPWGVGCAASAIALLDIRPVAFWRARPSCAIDVSGRCADFSLRRHHHANYLLPMTSSDHVSDRDLSSPPGEVGNFASAHGPEVEAWQRLGDNLTDTVLIVDRQGRIQYLNHLRIDIAYSDVMGSDGCAYVIEDHRELLRAAWESVFQTGTAVSYEVAAPRDDGEMMWFEGRAVPIRRNDEVVLLFVIATDITARHAALAALERSEQRYSLAQRAGQIGVWEWDAANDILYWSDTVGPLFGLEHGQSPASYKDYLRHIHNDDRPLVTDAIRAALAAGSEYRIEHRVVWADGTVRWLACAGEALVDEHGAVRSVLGTVQDITDRRMVEDEIVESQRELATILDSMQDTYYRTDTDGRLTRASPSARELLGYEPDELMGMCLANLYVDPEGRNRFLQALQEGEGRVQNFEAPLWRKDHDVVWVSTNAQYYRDQAGNIAGIEGISRDITGLKRAEDARIRLGRLLENSVNEIYVFDASSLRFDQVSHGAERNLGYSQDELHQLTALDIKPDLTRDEFEALLQPLHGSQKQVIFETRHRRKDGTSYPVEVRVQLLAEESPPVYLAVIQDISERKAAQAQMDKLSRALEQSADCVLITDHEGIAEYVNPAFESTTGYSREEVLGRKANVIKSGKHDLAFYERLWGTILGGEVFRDVLINKRKDGTLYYEEKTITPLKDEHGTITHFISTGKDITERMQTQERLHYLAHHDVLTHLPNRALFADRLEHALSRTRKSDRIVAVLFLDLDRFKIINDTLGHEIGDAALRSLSERLLRCVRESDTVARLGGDEFAVIMEDMRTTADVAPVARKILEMLSEPFHVEERELYITGSIGISMYPNDGRDAPTLLKNADIAMYRAKDLGRNTYQFYSADMGARAFERLTLETSLRHALEREEFVLYYQPQVDVRDGRVIGVEALLRWQHPDLGLVPPADFVALLEETGLIMPVGEWVLRQACTQGAAWHRQGATGLRVAVNLSSRQFSAGDLAQVVAGIAAETGFDPECLELEITESILMQHSATTMRALEELDRMGVRLSVDDFGTGYSSLSYLKRFPIDTLKVDRTFIRDIGTDSDDEAIVTAIVAMAKGLRLEVIAEGVESADQLSFLRQCGCHVVQGFFFAEPRLPDAIDIQSSMARSPAGIS